jgi:hypothetical protein
MIIFIQPTLTQYHHPYLSVSRLMPLRLQLVEVFFPFEGSGEHGDGGRGAGAVVFDAVDDVAEELDVVVLIYNKSASAPLGKRK